MIGYHSPRSLSSEKSYQWRSDFGVALAFRPAFADLKVGATSEFGHRRLGKKLDSLEALTIRSRVAKRSRVCPDVFGSEYETLPKDAPLLILE
jgi:hypothetical protein